MAEPEFESRDAGPTLRDLLRFRRYCQRAFDSESWDEFRQREAAEAATQAIVAQESF